jgi:hypothetical protein
VDDLVLVRRVLIDSRRTRNLPFFGDGEAGQIHSLVVWRQLAPALTAPAQTKPGDGQKQRFEGDTEIRTVLLCLVRQSNKSTRRNQNHQKGK